MRLIARLASLPPHRTTRAALGFTLIEILVVVTILGVISAVIVPQIGSRNDLKTSSAARALMADLMYAQNLAITQQKKIYVKFDATAATYKVLSAFSPETVVTHPVEVAPFVVKLGTSASASQLRNVMINAVSFNGQTTIAFDEMGAPYACTSAGVTSTMTAGSVVLKCGTNQLTVTVEPYTGELRVN